MTALILTILAKATVSMLRDGLTLCSLIFIGIAAFPNQAHAHASSQGFVLLLPTDTYTLVGWLVVLLTALAPCPATNSKCALAARLKDTAGLQAPPQFRA